MRVIAGAGERGPVVSSAVVLSALAIFMFTVVSGYATREVAPVVILVTLATVAYRSLLSWPALLGTLLAVIMLVPIRRYQLPGSLPFELELYRLLVIVIAAGWVTSLLIDPRVGLRRTGLERPLGLFALAVVGSVIVNPGRVNAVEADVTKKLMFLASFLLVIYIVVSVVRTVAVVDVLLRVLAVTGGIVAVFAIVESWTDYNVFDHLSNLVPLMALNEAPSVHDRGGRLRVFASAQHPIALGAMLIMLIPIAVYLARRSGRRRWLLLTVLFALGAFATVSRTSVVMLVVVGIVFLWLRPRETRRLLPALVPALVLVHLALPGAIGSLKSAFFPPGGLIAEQQSNPGWRGAGRIADLRPALSEYSRKPLLGEGFGTRVVDVGRQNAAILDNQWLGTLLETGALGVIAIGWLFVRIVRRLGRAAKEDESDTGWLFTALAAAITAYAVGMFTFDAFSFIQVTFVFYLLMAFSVVALSATGRDIAGTG